MTVSSETARDRRRLRTRRELARAAVQLFETRGFAATTVEDIAAAADYSTSTFFRLFPRKEDPVFFDMPDRLYALSATIDPSSSWRDLRAELINHARTWEEEDPEFAAARVRLFHTEPALTSRYLDYCRQYEEWLAELISARSPAAPSADVDARLGAACIVAALRAAFHAQAVTPAAGARSVATYLDQALDTLEAGPLRTFRAAG